MSTFFCLPFPRNHCSQRSLLFLSRQFKNHSFMFRKVCAKTPTFFKHKPVIAKPCKLILCYWKPVFWLLIEVIDVIVGYMYVTPVARFVTSWLTSSSVYSRTPFFFLHSVFHNLYVPDVFT